MDYQEQKTALMLQIASVVSCLILFSCNPEKVSSEKNGNADERLPYYNTPDFTPSFFNSKSEAEEKSPHRIADFSFTDQDNKMITQKIIEGKIHVADFFFTSCGSICPKMTSNMKQIDQAFGNDTNIVLLSYSVTPWLDSVSVLRQYALNHDVHSENWHLLTGTKSAIYDLARKSYFAEQELGFTKDSSEFLHTEHFLLVDETKHIRGIYDGTLALDIEQLIKDIQLLKKEN